MKTYGFPPPKTDVDLVELSIMLSERLNAPVRCSLGEQLLIHVDRELTDAERSAIEQSLKEYRHEAIAPERLVTFDELFNVFRALGIKITRRGLVVESKATFLNALRRIER